ncbi:MAG: sensor histidine kinase, partial [Oceanicaulis sp.]
GRLDGEIVYLKSRGGRPIETRMSLFWETGPDGEPVRAHCAFAEIGDLNAAHRELERRAGALERANRELDRFATVASHDMQEPLRKISAFASLLKTRWHGKIDADADRCLDYLVDAAGRMRRLIDDLLAYSRASSRPFEPQTVDLNAIWRDVADAYEMLIEEAEAALEIGPLPIVTGDRVLLQLLFANLLTNAIKYRKGQGVRVSLFAEPAEGGRVRLIFSDDGIGFEPRFAEKVFEPFSRLHPRDEYGGTGIGLAICQQAVERQHGSIRVDSAPGEGTRFIVELPGTVAGRGAEDAA